jgi:hypothetical protein
METAFLVCAGLGGTVLVLQFLAGVLGLSSDHDVDHDQGDAHGDGHGDAHGASFFISMLSFRSVTAGLTFFGIGGMTALQMGRDGPGAIAIAVLTGVAALAIVAQLLKWMKQLKSDGGVRLDQAVGVEAVVYLTIPGNRAGVGKVTVTLQKRTFECTAATASDVPLPTGTPVRIVAVTGPNDVDVEPLGVTS